MEGYGALQFFNEEKLVVPLDPFSPQPAGAGS
jgi:hypothetical protein